MTGVALLAAVATSLVGTPTTVRCEPLPAEVLAQEPRAFAMADPSVPAITISDCRPTLRRTHFGVTVLAHEILHLTVGNADRTAEPWTHEKIYRVAPWYGENVVRWKLRRFAARPAP